MRELEALRAMDPERALAWAEQGERWYDSKGVYAEARQAMIVTLLVDRGSMSEARDKARAFITAHPKSRYRPLVQGLTGVHPRPGPPPGF